MKIKLYWPKCNYHNKEWSSEEIDSYWVECTLEEAERKIFSYLSTEQINESQRNWKQGKGDPDKNKMETKYLCYLVSKNLSSIEPFPWYYPYSGQWNAYCPFKVIKEIEISDLKEILKLIIKE